MGREIERKFRVIGDDWRSGAEGERIRQGYLAFGPPTAVRVRISGGKANLNIKTATTEIERAEYEYAIPLADAEELLGMCQGHEVEKTRYRVEHAGRVWEIDVFQGVNAGLIVAEVELDSRDATFETPQWVGEEVSGDPRYLNTHLSLTPYREWK